MEAKQAKTDNKRETEINEIKLEMADCLIALVADQRLAAAAQARINEHSARLNELGERIAKLENE